MTRAKRSTRLLSSMAALMVIAFCGIAGSHQAQAQCVGHFTVSGVPFGTGLCDTLYGNTLWQNGECVNVFYPSVNGTYDQAMCCMAFPGSFLGIKIAGVTIGVGQTKLVPSKCGCIQVSVTGPDAFGNYSVSITLVFVVPCS